MVSVVFSYLVDDRSVFLFAHCFYIVLRSQLITVVVVFVVVGGGHVGVADVVFSCFNSNSTPIQI